MELNLKCTRAFRWRNEWNKRSFISEKRSSVDLKEGISSSHAFYQFCKPSARTIKSICWKWSHRLSIRSQIAMLALESRACPSSCHRVKKALTRKCPSFSFSKAHSCKSPETICSKMLKIQTCSHTKLSFQHKHSTEVLIWAHIRVNTRTWIPQKRHSSSNSSSKYNSPTTTHSQLHSTKWCITSSLWHLQTLSSSRAHTRTFLTRIQTTWMWWVCSNKKLHSSSTNYSSNNSSSSWANKTSSSSTFPRSKPSNNSSSTWSKPRPWRLKSCSKSPRTKPIWAKRKSKTFSCKCSKFQDRITYEQ